MASAVTMAPTMPMLPKATKYWRASRPEAKEAPASTPMKAIAMPNERLSMVNLTLGGQKYLLMQTGQAAWERCLPRVWWSGSF